MWRAATPVAALTHASASSRCAFNALCICVVRIECALRRAKSPSLQTDFGVIPRFSAESPAEEQRRRASAGDPALKRGMTRVENERVQYNARNLTEGMTLMWSAATRVAALTHASASSRCAFIALCICVVRMQCAIRRPEKPVAPDVTALLACCGCGGICRRWRGVRLAARPIASR